MRYDDLPADLDGFQREIERRDWGDGLPVIPPTPERVEAMLDGADPDVALGVMPPSGHEVLLGTVATNAVMAGCRPGMLPVLRAAVTAVIVPRFNLLGVQTTTHPAAPLTIVSGAGHLGVNAGAGTLGPGWAANATLGRAIRLVLMNIGGARPGGTDQATIGHPGKYSFIVGENVDESPWGEYIAPAHLRVPSDDPDAAEAFRSVTLVAGEGPHNISDHHSSTASEMMTSILGTVNQPGMNNWHYPTAPFVVLLCPEHAHLFAREGLRREDVADWLRREAGLEIERFSAGFVPILTERRFGARDELPPGTVIPALATAEQVIIVVTGGPGRHSMVIPTFGNSQPVQIVSPSMTTQSTS
ncbi:MAG: hypothetical protein R8G01_06610 [Ilumatobacteraceae bacterium]|nr:hypothetical protein [Ilumatobacteraceae bacterium]